MPDESPHLEIRWGAETYTTGELTAADMIAMEEEWGEPFGSIDFRSIKASCWLVWLTRRHHDPEVSLDDVSAITASSLLANVVPPTEGSPRRKRSSARSGGRSTPASTASAPRSSGA